MPIKLKSERLANKNLLPLAGHPLCWHVPHTLLQVSQINEVYVYCSNPAVTEYVPKEVIYKKRDSRLDGNLVKGFDIYNSFIKDVDAEIYVLAHTTSPFIKKFSIENALNHVLSGEHDSAFSAQRVQTFAWYQGKPMNYNIYDVPRTQDIEPLWIETSAFFIFKKEIFTVHHRRIGFSPYIQEVSGMEALDIDEKKDYDLACILTKAENIDNDLQGIKALKTD